MRARTIYRTSAATLAVLASCNVACLAVVWRRLKNPIDLTVEYHEPTVVQLPVSTNTPPSALVRSSPASVSSKPLISVPRRYTASYRYFEVGGRPFALLHGRYIQEGSQHAYGGVVAIYPERIYFDGGDYLDNNRPEPGWNGGKNESDSNGSSALP